MPISLAARNRNGLSLLSYGAPVSVLRTVHRDRSAFRFQGRMDLWRRRPNGRSFTPYAAYPLDGPPRRIGGLAGAKAPGRSSLRFRSRGVRRRKPTRCAGEY